MNHSSSRLVSFRHILVFSIVALTIGCSFWRDDSDRSSQRTFSATPTTPSNFGVESISYYHEGLVSRQEVSFDSASEQVEWVALGGGWGGAGICECSGTEPVILGPSSVSLLENRQWIICGYPAGKTINIELSKPDGERLVSNFQAMREESTNKDCAAFELDFPVGSVLGEYQMRVSDGSRNVETRFDLKSPSKPRILLNNAYCWRYSLSINTGETLSIQYAGFAPDEVVSIFLYRASKQTLGNDLDAIYSGEVLASWNIRMSEKGTRIEHIEISDGDPAGTYIILAKGASEQVCDMGPFGFNDIYGLNKPTCSVADSFLVHSNREGEKALPEETKIREQDGSVMVLVPSGEFYMGSDLGDESSPVHKVFVHSYWIDQTEIANRHFQKFIEFTGYQTTAEREGTGRVWVGEDWTYVDGANWRAPQGLGSRASDDVPVVQVSWYDAVEYCRWAGGRLPTEAEWEKAARGIHIRAYPWGNWVSGDQLNICDSHCPADWRDGSMDDGYRFLSPVGAFPSGASPYGALDMAGNVWEWTQDWYDAGYYANSPAQNPQGPPTGTDKILRGGSWGSRAIYTRTFNRFWGNPNRRDDDVGFRCVVDIP